MPAAARLAALASMPAAHPAVTVALIAFAWAVVETWPMPAHFTTYIFGNPGDATGTVALYWWWAYALEHGRSVFDNTLQGVPFGSSWNLIVFSPLPVFLFAPLSVLLGPIAAYNIEIISSWPLTAMFTFLLGRRLGMSKLGAAFAGLVFAATPWHVQAAMGHAGQAHLEFLPAALFFLCRWREGGSRWNLAAAGTVAGLQLWMDLYFAVILALLVGVWFATMSVVPSPRWASVRRRLVAHGAAAVAVALVTALFLPIAVVFAFRPGEGTVQSTTATITHPTSELIAYSAQPWFYVVPPHDNPLVPAAVGAWEEVRVEALRSNWTEMALFLGYTVLALAALGLVKARQVPATPVAVTIAAAGFLFSLPFDWRTPIVHIHPPARYIYLVLPFIRVYARFGVLVLLGSALLAGLGYEWLQRRGHGWWRSAVSLLPFLLVALEFNNVPPSHTTRILPAPAEYSWLRAQPPGTLVEYPVTDTNPPRQEIIGRGYALYQMVHEHPMFYTGVTAGPAAAEAPRLEPYYAPSSVDELRRLGIRYVFVHRAAYVATGRPVPGFVSGLTYVETVDGTDIYEVTPS